MPLAPNSLRITSASASAVALAWTAPSGPVPTSYNVYRSLASPAGLWGQPALLGSSTGTTFTDATGAPGKAYQYTITAITAAVESQPSNAVSALFVTPAAVVPGPLLDGLDEIFGGVMGCDAIYTAFGQAPVQIRGIYNGMVKDSVGKQGADITNSKPQLLCKATDVANATNKALVSISGIEFHVAGVDPDGAGMTTLWLSRDAQ